MNFGNSIQSSIYDSLTNNVDVSSAVKGVYDHVIQEKKGESTRPYPYIVIGQDSLAQFDTDTSYGAQGSIAIHVWSRSPGWKEIKDIQGLIYNALHNSNLNIPGYSFVSMLWDSTPEPFTDIDGVTGHGVIIFNITLDEE